MKEDKEMEGNEKGSKMREMGYEESEMWRKWKDRRMNQRKEREEKEKSKVEEMEGWRKKGYGRKKENQIGEWRNEKERKGNEKEKNEGMGRWRKDKERETKVK